MQVMTCMKRNVVSILSSATIRHAAARFLKDSWQFNC